MSEDYDTMTVVKLKGLCRERNLPVSGTKAILIERLSQSDSETQMTTESTIDREVEPQEKKFIEIKCIECPSTLRVPADYQGMVSCPSCSTRQDVSQALNTPQGESFELTPEQIGIAMMIGGILIGVFATWLVIAEWNLWFSCELGNTSGEEYTQLGCGQGTFFNTMFTSCCVLIPLGFLIGIFGYNYSESKNVDLQTPVVQGAGITPQTPTTNRSPLVGAIQATAVGYGIGIVSLIGIIVAIVFLVLIFILLLAASY